MYNALLLSEGGGIFSKSSVSPQMGSACLMIGIGGTGLAALRKVKREVYQHLEPDDPDADIPSYSKIAFLGIDTDTDDLMVTNPDITDLQADEQWSINVPSLGAKLTSIETKYDPCLKWLSPDIRIQGDTGAGGIRQVGRFCLFKRAGALRAKLSSLVNQVMSAADQASVQVHVFAGISGGTGSGCFLDVCYILRDVLNGINNSTVCGYFFLPDTLLFHPGIQGNGPVESYIKRNSYAALRELDYCMSIPSSGDVFKEDYASGFHVESTKAPVDLCHLISAIDSNGVIKHNGFNYSVNVLAEYIMNFMFGPDENMLWDFGRPIAFDDLNAIIESRRHYFQALERAGDLFPFAPRYGKRCFYSVLGASTAKLPLTEIGTYLAACTYANMRPSLGAHSSKMVCDNFAARVGCSTNGLVKELANGISTAIEFNPDPEKINSLNEDVQNWDKIPSALHGPYEACRTTAIGKIEANFKAQSRELDSYDYNRNAQVDHPTFVLRLFNELAKTALNPAEGPTMAADLLHGNGIHDLRAVLKGIEADISVRERSFLAIEPLRKQDIMNAAHKYNKAMVGWKNKLKDYEDAWTEYLRLTINLELCAKLRNLLPILERNIATMYRNYFAPLSEMIAELGQTFDANINWLNSPQHTNNDNISWRIFEYDAVKDQLDSDVLKQQDMSFEHWNFVSHLLDHYKEWCTRSPYNIARCVNEYMTERFHETLNKTVDEFLMSAYNVTNPAQLPIIIQTKLLNRVSVNASPLFWKSNTFLMDETTTATLNVFSIPAYSMAISNAAEHFAATNNNIVIRPSTLGDRIGCVRFVSGIPLYAYQGIDKLKGPYESSTDPGLHLHERDDNWRMTLPPIAPSSAEETENDPT